MAQLIDPARVELLFGRYGVAAAKDLNEPTLWPRAQEYKRLVAARLAPIEKRELRSRLPAGEYHLSRKIDGEFAVLVYAGGEALLVNPGGTVRLGLPLLAEAQQKLGRAGVKSALFAGELYYRHPGGQRSRVHDVGSAARQPKSQADLDHLCFAAFDVIELDGQPAPARHAETYARLQKLLGGGQRIHPVEAAQVKTVEEIEQYFDSWVEQQGGEGLVLRSDSAGSYKLKPRHTLDVAVVGFTEGSDERKGMLHDVLVAVVRRDGALHLLGRVGNGFSDEERRSFLAELKQQVVASDYVESSPEHIAYQMVRPRCVLEISCLDLLTQTSRGGSVDKMALHFDEKADRYAPLRRLPLASLISPVFIRRRDDKQVNASDVRIKQVADLVDIDKLDHDAHQLALPKSELLRREVYVRANKGQTMVRKLLMWKTNKEGTGEFPAYVLHFTDFSPGRKTPLGREIRVSNSREQIEALWGELFKENIVKGWTPA
jgi:ATP-dependent DNA ligase